jgi:hypothetical protein
MTATGHAVIGVAIAAVFPDPIVAIPIAFLSHIAADAFPHWDAGTNRSKKPSKRFVNEAFFDLGLSYVLTFVLVTFLFPETNLLYAYAIVIAAQFLDWASAPYVFLKITKPPFFYWAYKFQKKFDNRLDRPWGIIGQVSVLVAIILVALIATGFNPEHINL